MLVKYELFAKQIWSINSCCFFAWESHQDTLLRPLTAFNYLQQFELFWYLILL